MGYKTAHTVSLGGVDLGSVDDRILVLGCSADAGKDTMTTQAISGRAGQTVTGQTRDYIDASVKFGIRCRRGDMNARGEIFEKVMAWASKARDESVWLRFGQKPGRRLRVWLNTLPAEGDPWDWNAEYSIGFRAIEVPYWQDEEPISVTQSGETLEQQISVNGSARTVLNLTYLNGTANTCNTMDISTGAAEMHFTGLGIASGESLVINHLATGILRIRILSTSNVYRSAMAARVAATSDDDLWIKPGLPTVSATAQRSGTWTISCYGRYE